MHRQPIICQVLHTLHVGGAEMLAARLGRQLQSECRFVYVCLDEIGTLGEELRAEGFPVEVLGRQGGFDWRCALKLASIVHRERVELIHAHQYTPFFYSMVARLLRRQPAVLFTEHGRHFPDYPRPKRKFANRLLLERRDRVVGVGQAVRQALIDNEGIPAGRVGVIYNGIDTSTFRGAIHDREAVRRELGIGPNDFVILMVARLDYLKDHATAVRTIQRVAARRPEAKLVLVGEGPERAAIQQLVESQQLNNCVKFLGLRKDVPRLLNGADLFLLTSISEGIPLTVIEAMLVGLPVVATRVGGLPEVVVDGETGWLAPAGDDACLAEGILRLASDAQDCRRLGNQGRTRAERLFSETLMLERYLALYREMVRG